MNGFDYDLAKGVDFCESCVRGKIHRCPFLDTLSSTEKEQWRTAMQKEMDSIHSNVVWDLVELPEGHKPVGSKWVFKRKTGADGSIETTKLV